MERIEMLREIVANHQCRKIRIDGKKVYVDAQTANLAVSIYDRLNETNRANFIALPWDRFVTVCWKLAA